MAKQTVSDAQIYAMARSILGREPDMGARNYIKLAKSGKTEQQLYSLMQTEVKKVGRKSNKGIFKPNSKLNQSLAKKYVPAKATKPTAKVVKGTAITGPTPKKIPTVKQALDNKYTVEKNVETAKKNFEKSEEKKTMSFMEYLQKEESGLYNRLQKAIAGQEQLPAAYERIAGEENIPGIQQQLGAVQGQVSDVSSLLDTLEEDVNTRTSPFIVNESQRRRQLAAEGDPLRNQLGRLTAGQTELSQQLQTASGNVASKMGYLTQQQQQNLEPLRTEIGAFADRAAREMTGFTNDKQVRLNNLLDAINAGRTLSNDQWLLANQLAQEERTFQNQLKLNTQTYQQNLGLMSKEFDYNKELAKLSGSGSGSGGLTLNLGGGTTTTNSSWEEFVENHPELFGDDGGTSGDGTSGDGTSGDGTSGDGTSGGGTGGNASTISLTTKNDVPASSLGNVNIGGGTISNLGTQNTGLYNAGNTSGLFNSNTGIKLDLGQYSPTNYSYLK